MYTTIDADGYLSSLFFIFGFVLSARSPTCFLFPTRLTSLTFLLHSIIVLFFWLSQLAVAVVVNIFGDIRAETKKSAFGATS